MELRPYQNEAVRAAWLHLKRGLGNPVIQLPTGAGKSLVIAELCRMACEQFKGRVIVLAHRRELLNQNTEKIKALLPFGITCGIYSAGLKSRNKDDDVICGGIQSVFKRANEFGRRHLVIIDEVHLTPDDGEGMYRRFIEDLAELNPKLKIIGTTATPFRMTTGSICGPDKLFSEICYTAKIQPLIVDGYLSPMNLAPTAAIFDTSNLRTRAGEFIASEVEQLFDDGGKSLEACKEIIESTPERKSILLFSSGVAHANHLASIITQLTGERCEAVTGDTSPLERAAMLSDFKNQRLRWLVGCEILTTGFDAPCIDAIAIIRATQSPGLYAQIIGRGFRVFPGKLDVKILDYGGNAKRHGPIDSDSFGLKPKRAMAEILPGELGKEKQCPACEEWTANATKLCPCGWLFHKAESSADTTSQILATPQKWQVLEVSMNRHRKARSSGNDPDTLRVNYTCQPFGEETKETPELTDTPIQCPECRRMTSEKDALVEIMQIGPHYAKASCDVCNRFLKWIKKPRVNASGNLTEEVISCWVCLEHPSGEYAFRKAWAWWSQRSMANPYTEAKELGCEPIEAAIDLWKRGAMRTPVTITTIADGKWFRLIAEEFDDEIPTSWQAPAAPREPIGEDEWGQPIYADDEELPF